MRKSNMRKSFEERIEELKAFKEKHGHVGVTSRFDQSLGKFCENMRCTRRGTWRQNQKPMAVNIIKALDELGFEWGHQELGLDGTVNM